MAPEFPTIQCHTADVSLRKLLKTREYLDSVGVTITCTTHDDAVMEIPKDSKLTPEDIVKRLDEIWKEGVP